MDWLVFYLLHCTQRELKALFRHRNPILRLYARPAGCRSHTGLFGIQMYGDMTVTFEVVDVAGFFQYIIGKGDDTELERTVGIDKDALSGFVRQLHPADIRRSNETYVRP